MIGGRAREGPDRRDAGYVGSTIASACPHAGISAVILDSLVTGQGTTVREPRLGAGAGAHEDQLVICLIGQKAYRGRACQDRELRDIASNK